MECLVLFLFFLIMQRTLGLSCAANFIFFNVGLFPHKLSQSQHSCSGIHCGIVHPDPCREVFRGVSPSSKTCLLCLKSVLPDLAEMI